jgi:hypothetical protein
MKLASKFNLSGRDPINGGKAGIYEAFVPAEIAAAYTLGTGPGVPDDNGTIVAGTIEPGHIVSISTAAGTAGLATSPDLTAAVPQLMFVVFSGDDDFSGATAGSINCIHGGCRFDTEKFNSALSYTPGAPLRVAAGVINTKVFGDNLQIVGFVGPRGVLNGVLDVIMPQGVCYGN